MTATLACAEGRQSLAAPLTAVWTASDVAPGRPVSLASQMITRRVCGAARASDSTRGIDAALASPAPLGQLVGDP